MPEEKSIELLQQAQEGTSDSSFVAISTCSSDARASQCKLINLPEKKKMKPSGCTATTLPAWAPKPTWQITERPSQTRKDGNDTLLATVTQPTEPPGRARQPPSLQTFPSSAPCPPLPRHRAGSQVPLCHGGLCQGARAAPFQHSKRSCCLRASRIMQLWSQKAGLTVPTWTGAAHLPPAHLLLLILVWEHWLLFICWFPGCLGRRSFLLCRATVWQKYLQPSQSWSPRALGFVPVWPKSYPIPKARCQDQAHNDDG